MARGSGVQSAASARLVFRYTQANSERINFSLQGQDVGFMGSSLRVQDEGSRVWYLHVKAQPRFRVLGLPQRAHLILLCKHRSHSTHFGSRVQGLWFGFQRLGFRNQVRGFRNQVRGFRNQVPGCRV